MANEIKCPHCNKKVKELLFCVHEDGELWLCKTCEEFYMLGFLDINLVKSIVVNSLKEVSNFSFNKNENS